MATAMTELTPERVGPGSRLAGRYRLEAVIGSGGMAVVWRARDESLDRLVAVKMMSDALSVNPSSVSRFAREARIAASISHPNLVEVYDYSATASLPYLVMQYVDGGTLEDRLKRGPLSPRDVRQLACDLLSALVAVHGAGVLHRDVKPANVLLDRDGQARLTDFGVARLEDATALTQPGHLVGTLRFLAPELTRGGPPSPRSDIYSLGILLREAAGGPARDRLGDLVAWLGAVDPEARPASAAAALERLSAISSDELSSRPPTAGQSSQDEEVNSEVTRALSPTEPLGLHGGTATVATPRRGPAAAPRHRAAATPRLGRSDRSFAAAALVLAAAVIVAIILASTGGGTRSSASRAGHPTVPGHLTLEQRVSRLGAEVRSAPGR